MFVRGVKSMGKLDMHGKGCFKGRRNTLLEGEIVFLKSSVDRTSSEEL